MDFISTLMSAELQIQISEMLKTDINTPSPIKQGILLTVSVRGGG